MSTQEILMTAVTTLMGVVAYFVRGVHKDIQEIAKVQNQQAIIQSVQDSRLGRAESDIASLRLWKEDISNFFASMGFKKRDG